MQVDLNFVSFISLLKEPFKLAKPEVNSSHLFGFADFFTVLAIIMVLITQSDIRYKFRVEIAPIPIQNIIFILIPIIGIGTLLLDFSWAKNLMMPKIFADQIFCQLILGMFVFLPICVWIFFTYVRPSVFGRLNSKKYLSEFKKILLKEDDMAVIAHELSRSVKNLVKYSTQISISKNTSSDSKLVTRNSKRSGVEAYQILQLMGNRKFCRYVANIAPDTAKELFEQMSKQGKYDLPIKQFVVNVFTELLINKDSIIYYDNDQQELGFSHKTFSQALFGNYKLIEELARRNSSPLQLPVKVTQEWDAAQLDIFCKCFLVFIDSYIERGYKSETLSDGFEILEKINDDIGNSGLVIEKNTDTDAYKKFKKIIKFIENLISLLEKTIDDSLYKSQKNQYALKYKPLYDKICRLMMEIIYLSSNIKCSPYKCWSIQYNKVFYKFFSSTNLSYHRAIITHRLRRLVYDEFKYLLKNPNYFSARILGFFINVLGVTLRRRNGPTLNKYYYALNKVMRDWLQKNYLTLHKYYPVIAQACLLGTISFDIEKKRLVKSHLKRYEGDYMQDFLLLKDTNSQ